MGLTTKQIKIMQQVVDGNGRDAQGNLNPIDLDELIERLDYKPTKESLQFSIRALIKHELIYKGPKELRRGRIRITIFPTDAGMTLITGRPKESILEPDFDALNATFDGIFAPAALKIKSQ